MDTARIAQGLLFLWALLPFAFAAAFTNSYSSECSTSQYYNLTLYECTSCGVANAIKASDGVSCTCAAGYYPAYTGNSLSSCTRCASGGLVTPLNTTCTALDSTTASYTSALSDFLCASMNQYLYIARTGTLSCRDCSGLTYASNSKAAYACFTCPDYHQTYTSSSGSYACTCTSDYTDIGGTCAATTLATAFTTTSQGRTSYYVKYSNIENSNDQISGSTVVALLTTLDSTLKRTWFNCLYGKNNTECQQLSNLCVLAYYDKSNPACAAYLSIASSLSAQDSANFE